MRGGVRYPWNKEIGFVIDSLLVAAALFASQGGYGMPAPPSIPRTERLPESTEPAAPAPQPIVPAVPGKTLRDLPNITYTYIDVSGRDFKAINKSLERQQKP